MTAHFEIRIDWNRVPLQRLCVAIARAFPSRKSSNLRMFECHGVRKYHFQCRAQLPRFAVNRRVSS